MKSKSIIFSLLSMLVLFSNNSLSETKTIEISSPENVVKTFYKEYLSAIDNKDVNIILRDSQKTIDKYTTKHLQKLEGQNDTGSDYFIAAQETCPEWIDNIVVEKIKDNGRLAKVKLSLGYGGSISIYNIQVKKQNNRWRMDSVDFNSRASGRCSTQD